MSFESQPQVKSEEYVWRKLHNTLKKSFGPCREPSEHFKYPKNRIYTFDVQLVHYNSTNI
uniref:Uncharacterized protein n=1 Tax=Arion vulgaris TaxID=1028688 RepID=A0A0B7BJP3_9EUPU